MSEDLTILQGLVKGDPEGYKSEALQQHEYFLAQYEIFKMKPSKDVKQFSLLVKFLSQVCLSLVSQVDSGLRLSFPLFTVLPPSHSDIPRLTFTDRTVLSRTPEGVPFSGCRALRAKRFDFGT